MLKNDGILGNKIQAFHHPPTLGCVTTLYFYLDTGRTVWFNG